MVCASLSGSLYCEIFRITSLPPPPSMSQLLVRHDDARATSWNVPGGRRRGQVRTWRAAVDLEALRDTRITNHPNRSTIAMLAASLFGLLRFACQVESLVARSSVAPLIIFRFRLAVVRRREACRSSTATAAAAESSSGSASGTPDGCRHRTRRVAKQSESWLRDSPTCVTG